MSSAKRICRGCKRKQLTLANGKCRSCRSDEALLGNVEKRQESIFYRKWLKPTVTSMTPMVDLYLGSSGRLT